MVVGPSGSSVEKKLIDPSFGLSLPIPRRYPRDVCHPEITNSS